jgi:hypothetical protein
MPASRSQGIKNKPFSSSFCLAKSGHDLNISSSLGPGEQRRNIGTVEV